MAAEKAAEAAPKKMDGATKAPSWFLPTNIELLVLGAGGNGQPKSLLLATTGENYLFNCGEGTQRNMAALSVKQKKLNNILITYKSWQNVGGLLGMSLNLKEVAVPKVTIHGPPGVENVILLGRQFTDENVTEIEKTDLDDGQFSDIMIDVEYVQLEVDYQCRRQGSAVVLDGEESHVTQDGEEENGLEKSREDEEEMEPQTVSRKRSRNTDISVVYVCKPKKLLPKFNKEKLKELKVPRGPWMKRLLEEDSITLPDGREIKATDVLDPIPESKAIVVLEVPNERFLEPLMSNPRLQELAEQKPGVDVIVHMSCRSIVSHQTYQEFINRYDSSVKHVFLNENCPVITSENAYRLQTALNLIEPHNYPLLRDTDRPHVCHVTDDSMVTPPAGFRYIIRPKPKFTWDSCVNIDKEEFTRTAMEVPEFPQALEDFHRQSKLLPDRPDGPEYPEVVFLGTASSRPGLYRNVTLILVHTSPDSVIVMDCGEDSIGQLHRFYGDKTDEVLRKIKAVFISHKHTDHYMGIMSLVGQRARALREAGMPYKKLCVILPKGLQVWFHFYEDEIESDFLHSVLIIPTEKLTSPKYKKLIAPLGLKMTPVLVEHCRFAYGVVLEHENGWKLVYSGDTKPTSNLVEAGMDCDFLIHEATFESSLVEEALRKKHSTIGQAIGIAKSMRAKFTMLTHFSQRYHKLPYVERDEMPQNVGIAFDNMRVTFSDFNRLSRHIDILQVLFKEDLEALKCKRQKMDMKNKDSDGIVQEKTNDKETVCDVKQSSANVTGS